MHLECVGGQVRQALLAPSGTVSLTRAYRTLAHILRASPGKVQIQVQIQRSRIEEIECKCLFNLAPRDGLEPPTNGLTVSCYSHLRHISARKQAESIRTHAACQTLGLEGFGVGVQIKVQI